MAKRLSAAYSTKKRARSAAAAKKAAATAAGAPTPAPQRKTLAEKTVDLFKLATHQTLSEKQLLNHAATTALLQVTVDKKQAEMKAALAELLQNGVVRRDTNTEDLCLLGPVYVLASSPPFEKGFRDVQTEAERAEELGRILAPYHPLKGTSIRSDIDKGVQQAAIALFNDIVDGTWKESCKVFVYDSWVSKTMALNALACASWIAKRKGANVSAGVYYIPSSVARRALKLTDRDGKQSELYAGRVYRDELMRRDPLQHVCVIVVRAA